MALEHLIGSVLAQRYELKRLVGTGGMGAVFAATQLDLQRSVAVKVLLGAGDREAFERFRAEALAVAAASHANVVQLFECRVDHDPPFLAMELLEGETLSVRLARERRLSIDAAVEIAVQLLSALEAAHARGVVHRDLKPANVFLVRHPVYSNLVKLLDFGVAKLADGGVRTATGDVLGTPAYMAPEQVRGEPVDARTDLHAIGVLLYQMLAGQRPWAGIGGDVLVSILREPPTPIAPLRSDLPPALVALIMRALAKDPAERFGSASAMLEALKAARADPALVAETAPRARAMSVATPTASKADNERRPGVMLFVVASLTILVVGAPLAYLLARAYHANGALVAAGDASVGAATNTIAPADTASIASAETPSTVPGVDVEAGVAEGPEPDPSSTPTQPVGPALRRSTAPAPTKELPAPKRSKAGEFDAGPAESYESVIKRRAGGRTTFAVTVVAASYDFGHLTEEELRAVRGSASAITPCLGLPFVPGGQLKIRVRYANGVAEFHPWWLISEVPSEMRACIQRVLDRIRLPPRPGSSAFNYYYDL